MTDGKWTYIDRSGKQITAPRFSRAKPFREGLALVCVGGDIDVHGMFDGGKRGFIDPSGKWAIRAQFDSAYSFSEGLAWVCNNKNDGTLDKWGCIDTEGRMVIKPVYNELTDFEDGAAWAHTGGKQVEHAFHQPPRWEGGTRHYIDKVGKSFWSIADDSE